MKDLVTVFGPCFWPLMRYLLHNSDYVIYQNEAHAKRFQLMYAIGIPRHTRIGIYMKECLRNTLNLEGGGVSVFKISGSRRHFANTLCIPD